MCILCKYAQFSQTQSQILSGRTEFLRKMCHTFSSNTGVRKCVWRSYCAVVCKKSLYSCKELTTNLDQKNCQLNDIKQHISYSKLKFKKHVKFCVWICPIIAGLVTLYTVCPRTRCPQTCKYAAVQFICHLMPPCIEFTNLDTISESTIESSKLALHVATTYLNLRTTGLHGASSISSYSRHCMSELKSPCMCLFRLKSHVL